MRRRRALLLLLGILIVGSSFGDHTRQPSGRGHHHSHRSNFMIGRDFSISSDRLPATEMNGFLAAIPVLGRLPWTVSGSALREPGTDALRRTLSLASLTIDLSCASSVTLLPQAGLGDQVILSVRRGQDEALQSVRIESGVLAQSSGCEGEDKGDFVLQIAPEKAFTLVQHDDLDIRGGRFGGSVTIDASGSGSVVLDAVGSLIDHQEAADVYVGEINGDITADLAGSGDLRLVRGHVGHLAATLNGSGDLSTGETAIGTLDAQLTGSGDLTAERVGASVVARTTGSGDISIGTVTAGMAQLVGTGSGDIVIDGGRIGTLNAQRSGSGDLTVRASIDTANVSHHGSGELTLPHVSGRIMQDGGDQGGDDDN